MGDVHLIRTIAVENEGGQAMLLEYFACEHRRAGFWSVTINKREEKFGRTVGMEQASACCGAVGRVAVIDFVHRLADGIVTPVALDDAVCDLLAEYAFEENCVV